MNYDYEYCKLKQIVMDDNGICGEDMDDPDAIYFVNRQTDLLFEITFGFPFLGSE